MPSVIKTDKIENSSGETIFSKHNDLGWSLGKNVHTFNNDNGIVQTKTYKTIIDRDRVTNDFGFAYPNPDPQYDREGYPQKLIDLPAFEKTSNDNSVLLKIAFQPYIKGLRLSRRTNRPNPGNSGFYSRFYILGNATNYSLDDDLTSAYPMAYEFPYTSQLGHFNISSTAFPRGNVIGRGNAVGWEVNVHPLGTTLHNTRSFFVPEGPSTNLTRTYSLFGMCGYNYVVGPYTNTDVEELPYNPNHVVGLKAGTYLTAVIFEVKSSSIFTERNQH